MKKEEYTQECIYCGEYTLGEECINCDEFTDIVTVFGDAVEEHDD